jgi:hypothetical protein
LIELTTIINIVLQMIWFPRKQGTTLCCNKLCLTSYQLVSWFHLKTICYLSYISTHLTWIGFIRFFLNFWVCYGGSNGRRKDGRSCYRRNRHSYSECQKFLFFYFLFVSLNWFNFLNRIKLNVHNYVAG